MVDATFTYRLDDISQLYLAPELNPFSTNELAVVGQSALERVFRHLESVWQDRQIKLTLLLPPEAITTDMEQQIHEAVQRYCQLKMVEALLYDGIPIRQQNRSTGWCKRWRLSCVHNRKCLKIEKPLAPSNLA
jgi:hypothetical protein